MKTSSFLCGLVLGATASMMMSRKRPMLMNALGQGQAAGRAKDKIVDMALTGFGSTANRDKGTDHSVQGVNAAKHESEPKSHEANLKMLKDFIRSNPEVKHDVERILRETHTTVPGL
ncbi:hypothetical protein F4V43_01510 [Paenibacillus spiritus]|uniref:Uncharacterized protein n=1 Tax=Paenibacillus spiritus TaxID=2496557 RepID=A0A5J5GGQ3_9BACL|nr:MULTISPECIES: hypothetical protein [Paenibacillus]KAA9007190.1 hypothetical protein F4V43_01510 [Paenibacillus spiritus]